MRLPLALVVVAACGDNLRPPVAPPDTPPPSEGCTPTAGTHIVQRRIVWACSAMGAPQAPDCINDVAVLVTSPPDDARLFVVGEHGQIRIVDHEQLLPTPFADLSYDAGGPVWCPDAVSELGLLGLAFHPRFASNHQLFLYYTSLNPDTTDTVHPYIDVLARYTISANDPNRIDPHSVTVLLAIPDPFSNHQGGMIEFGSDGYLYLSTGDGGATLASGSDPFHNSQDPTKLLGKILRIDVDHASTDKPYSIPGDNPFGNEVWVLGMRNPWRWSFDRATGDMWIGDVGLATYEEIDMLPAGRQAGVNLGWSMYEGMSCFEPPCDATDKTFPVDIETHANGWWAIIGGEVYRGSCYPDLVGRYIYADCGKEVLSVGRYDSNGVFSAEMLADTALSCPTSVHSDARGELYETDVIGDVYHLEVGP